MGLIVLLLLIGVPTLEVFVFIEIGGQIGLFNTVSIICITAIIGTYLLRRQGLSVLNRVQHSLSKNELPVKEIVDGVFLLIAGILLLTPGFVTDGIGFILFVPLIRLLLGQYFLIYLSKKGHNQPWDNTNQNESQQHFNTNSNQNDTIIDGNFEEIDDEQKKL